MLAGLKQNLYFCNRQYNNTRYPYKNYNGMMTILKAYDRFSCQALQELHRYRAVMFSPTLCR